MSQQSSSERPRCAIVGQRTAFGIHSFKDRAEELTAIRRHLENPSVRIISLLGRPGIGKSLLAVRALNSIATGRWPDGETSAPPDAVVFQGQRTTGISFERLFFDCLTLVQNPDAERLQRLWAGGQPPAGKASALFDALAPRKVMLLLDNLEDVLTDDGQFVDDDLAEVIETLLSHEYGPRLLVTSQIPLALDTQHRRAERSKLLENGLPLSDAVVLLRELDPDGRSGLRDADEEVLNEIAIRVHCVPRGLEMIAGILREDMSMPNLREWLSSAEVIENVVRQLAHRMYQTLTPERRLVTHTLAIFDRPVALSSLEWVLQGILPPALDLQSVLSKLVDNHLVQSDRDTRTYALLPMDVGIARIDLEAQEPEMMTRLHRRVADWYFRFAPSRQDWQSPEDVRYKRLELYHRQKAGDYDEAALVLDQIADFLLWRGSPDDVLLPCKELGGRLSGDEARLSQLLAAGHAHYIVGPVGRAAELLKDAEQIAIRLKDRPRLQRALFLIGNIHRWEGHPDEAVPELRRAADLAAAEPQMIWQRSHALLGLSLAYSYRGEASAALEVATKLDQLAVESTLPIVRGHTCDARACAYAVRRDWRSSAVAIQTSIEEYSESDIPEALGFAWNVLGLARIGEGDLQSALNAFEKGMMNSAEVKTPRSEALCSFNRAWALWRTGRTDEAEAAAQAAASAYRRCGARDEHAAEALCEALAAHRVAAPQSVAQYLERCAELLGNNPDLCPQEWIRSDAQRIRSFATSSS